ncbi:unnamed protein product [Miscanthus lutarioriparius]|uniref:Uncharacterized protein n=1 Tax=Miscanthus lutarioriparius TaxID=422564 RepID=A0A811MTQ8_9POAL|nr:unnamed protein product [Miscanthus lutarioriparius]
MEAAIDTYFRGVDLDRVDWISSQEVVAFFKGSSLPQPVLAHVTRSGCDEGGHRRLLLVAQAAIDPGVFYSEGSAARARRGRGRCCRRFCIGVAAPRSLICLPASRRPSDLPTPYHLPDARRLRSRAEKPDGSAPERTFFGFKPSRTRPPDAEPASAGRWCRGGAVPEQGKGGITCDFSWSYMIKAIVHLMVILVPSGPSMWLAGMIFGYGWGFLIIIMVGTTNWHGGTVLDWLFRERLHVWLTKWPQQIALIKLAGFSVTTTLHLTLTLTNFHLAAPYRVPCSGALVPRHECSPVVDRKFQV